MGIATLLGLDSGNTGVGITVHANASTECQKCGAQRGNYQYCINCGHDSNVEFVAAVETSLFRARPDNPAPEPAASRMTPSPPQRPRASPSNSPPSSCPRTRATDVVPAPPSGTDRCCRARGYTLPPSSTPTRHRTAGASPASPSMAAHRYCGRVGPSAWAGWGRSGSRASGIQTMAPPTPALSCRRTTGRVSRSKTQPRPSGSCAGTAGRHSVSGVAGLPPAFGVCPGSSRRSSPKLASRSAPSAGRRRGVVQVTLDGRDATIVYGELFSVSDGIDHYNVVYENGVGFRKTVGARYVWKATKRNVRGVWQFSSMYVAKPWSVHVESSNAKRRKASIQECRVSVSGRTARRGGNRLTPS